MSKHIALVYGGDSSEYIISERSGIEIYNHLQEAGFHVTRIRTRNNEWTAIADDGSESEIDLKDFSLTKNEGEKIRFDFAFIIIHGTPGEDGKLQAMFDMYGIPYNTSGVLSSALTFNKYFCKIFLQGFQILTPDAYLLKKGEKPDIDSIIQQTGLPLFVKPNKGGSSFGISKVNNKEDLEAAIEEALKEDDELIIESFIKGREFSCGLMKNSTGMTVFPLTEIVPKKDFFDYEAKYTKGMSEEITPAEIPEELEVKCKKIAGDIYNALNCQGIVRIDFILKENEFYFLELNSIPGMSRESIVPQQIRAMGKTEKEILKELIDSLT